jgi:hypothetical protein
MKTLYNCFILAWLPFSTLIVLAILLVTVVILLLVLQKRRRKNVREQEVTGLVDENTLLPQINSEDFITATNTESSSQPEPAEPEQNGSEQQEVRLPFSEAESNSLFQKFVVEWMNESGLEWKQISLGDDSLIFFERNIPEFNQTLSMAAVCVWKPGLIKGRVEWARSYQMINYRQYETSNGIPLYMIAGIGGKPDQPHSVHIVPLKKIRSNALSESQLNSYALSASDDLYLHVEKMQPVN